MSAPDKQERTLLDAIRRGTAQPQVKRQASRGTIPVAADELLEILVFLTHDHDPTCSEEAKRTLASWPAEKISSLLAQPTTSPEVLAYFAQFERLPELIVSGILLHPNPGDSVLTLLAPRLSQEQIQQLLDSHESSSAGENLPGFRAAVLQRPNLPAELRLRLQPLSASPIQPAPPAPAPRTQEEQEESPSGVTERRTRITLTQKIARMSVSERIHLALTGTKEERLILVRDPSKQVYRSVVRSQKLSDSEVETIAAMNNVPEEVLRMIANERKYTKNYMVVKNLVYNPRTPIDVSLSFLQRLNDQDLRILTHNRNVPETVRSLAERLHKQRSATRAGTR